MKKQRGFTVVEVMAVLVVLTVLTGAGVAIFTAVHFIGKFW
jgi:prepilin-type N-terminal cleavage/methylation domain-containing protein